MSSETRAKGPVLISMAINAAIATALLHALATARQLDRIREVHAAAPALEAITERVAYVELRESQWPLESTDRARTRIAPPVLIRPSIARPTSSRLPTVNRTDTDSLPGRRTSEASGDIDDDRGGVSLAPQRRDPRIWASTPSFVPRDTARTDVLEGTVARAVRMSNDSVAALGIQTVTPDWIVERDGRKFGLDNKGVHLGKVTIPGVLVGLLPIQGFGCMPTLYFPERPVRDSVGMVCITLENPGMAERRDRINEMSAEIRARARPGAREEIDRIAGRKDRERAARLRGQQNVSRTELSTRSGTGSPPPASSPTEPPVP